MKRLIIIIFLMLISLSDKAQTNLYYPPAGNTVWDTISPNSLGWCQERIDTLLNYLQLKNTKSFIILKDGKIALEKYYGTFTKDSLWYWASAGKSLTAFLTGVAQDEGALDIQQPTATYLGQGWTSAPPEKEALIKVWHQLTMTTGLDYNVNDLNCTDPNCLTYLNDAGEFWYYHNAPYQLISDVVANATGTNYNVYTNSRVKAKTGMSSGIWLDGVYYSRTRDAARFGLMMLNKAIWDGDTLLHDTAYYNAMINTSQSLNQSYGYLWWLNGKSSHRLPGINITIPGEIIPTAPADMYAALGKNDQKIYVVPSMNMVVVRFGNAADGSNFALSDFDDNLWQRIMDLECDETAIIETKPMGIKVYPNPSNNIINIQFAKPINKSAVVELYNNSGQLVYGEVLVEGSTTYNLNIGNQPAGMYIYKVQTNDGVVTGKVVVE
ncbi:MAG: serine hydrolase [Sphingobacteriales bacterium JAD_PAG50586_3]|nr:MAG: serine hydrolase [Sphingobacteriales bacterium JAD_PAG50586_3]